MKLKAIRKTDEEVNVEITGATLLSVEEVEALPDRLRTHTDWWWLRSPGHYYDCAVSVRSDGTISNYRRCFCDDNVVRPALRIENLESANLKIGDSIIFADKEFEIISNELALCKVDIGKHCFKEDDEAEDANDYEKSGIKKFVDKWFKKAKNKETTSTHNYECIYVGCSLGGEDYAE